MNVHRDELQPIGISTEWILLRIRTEPYLIMTNKGYRCFVDVRESGSKTRKRLLIEARSLGEPLDEMVIENDGLFKGIDIEVRKDSKGRLARYLVREPK
jgi:hypothetical protein